MIRLGHIDYSNCLPVHAPLLDGGFGVEIVRGVPTQLNEALARGDVDVAPCSSVEYARHAARYRIVPGLAIGSSGEVGSIRLECAQPLTALHGRAIAVPTASATSTVLLRALLELRMGVVPRLVPFEQEADSDPVAAGAAAALRIGDPALRRVPPPGRCVYDLGRLWTEWTGLPFVFAVWQTGLGRQRDAELAALHGTLHAARARFAAADAGFAERHAAPLGMRADALLCYWRSLRYDLDATMQQGLLHFFSLAAQLGEAPAVSTLRFTPVAAAG